MADTPNATRTIHELRAALANGSESPTTLADQALACSDQNASNNTYLWQDCAWTRAEAARAEAIPIPARHPLSGLPVSVKDCFDLAGAPTSCGVHFYRNLNGIAAHDSWLVERLRSVGAVITGKTHLHPLAYGITGQNPEFGDCLQPRDPTALTGGSSSGAAASIQEGSAAFAIGTDTGGSIRVPAALCGLAGYRASIGRGDWSGGAHLAPSFDTMGGLFRHLEDAPLLASIFCSDHPLPPPHTFTRFAVVDDTFLHDCDPAILANLHATVRELESLGLRSTRIDPTWWAEAYDIFAPIQASEAAMIHAGYFDKFEPSIRQRLEWGASLQQAEIAALRQRHQSFNARMSALFAEHELILLPAAPLARLDASADHSQTRTCILRYTTPFSLAGNPVVTIPCSIGGMQLGSPHGSDESLLQLAGQFGARRKSNIPPPTS